jgi:hypothetical protein
MDAPKTNVKVGELSFALFQRPLHPELFSIYSRRHLKTEKYETMIWATGGAHVVSVFSKKMCMTEVISPPGQMLPVAGLLEKFAFKGQKNHKCTLGRGFNYMTDFQVERMTPSLYKQSHADLSRFSKNRGVFVTFPKLAAHGLEPFTYLDFEARRDELQIHAFHAYPEQVTIVKTQSLFNFR